MQELKSFPFAGILSTSLNRYLHRRHFLAHLNWCALTLFLPIFVNKAPLPHLPRKS